MEERRTRDMEGMRSESWGSSVAAWEAMRGFELWTGSPPFNPSAGRSVWCWSLISQWAVRRGPDKSREYVPAARMAVAKDSGGLMERRRQACGPQRREQ